MKDHFTSYLLQNKGTLLNPKTRRVQASSRVKVFGSNLCSDTTASFMILTYNPSMIGDNSGGGGDSLLFTST